MAAYLAQASHRPRRSQYRQKRRKRPTGCTVVHTAENVYDKVGPDTGAENVSAFIAFRSDPGSYHDLVDSDSNIHLVPYESEAYQDGTGSNPWAMSLSFALAGKDWPKLSASKRDAFLRQGAIAFLRQQEWLASQGFPLTPLRQITRAQSEAGEAGFIGHGKRDPGRRTDPEPFPWARFFEIITELAVRFGSQLPDTPEENEDMFTLIRRKDGLQALISPARVIVSPSDPLIKDFVFSKMVRNEIKNGAPVPVQHGDENFKRLVEACGGSLPR